MIWSHIESSHLLLASLRVQGAHYNSRESSKDTSSCPGCGALLLIHTLSEWIACRCHQGSAEGWRRHLPLQEPGGDAGETPIPCEVLIKPPSLGFGSNSLLLCGVILYCKMALKFCPSGESGGQQRGQGRVTETSHVPRNTAGYVGTCPRQGWVKQGPGIG